MIEESPTEIETQDFKFMLFSALKAEDGETFDSCKDRLSLVASSSKYNRVFQGFDQGFKVFELKDVEIPFLECLGKVDLSSPPFTITLSCDELTLAVGLQCQQTPHVDLYDTQAFKSLHQQPAPFLTIRLSTTPDVMIRELVWSPTAPHVFAACLTNGVLGIYETENCNLKINSALPAQSGVTAISWSPKGKQIVVGKENGTFGQYKPEGLIEVKSFPAPSISENGVYVSSILWISTSQFLIGYVTQKSLNTNVMVVNVQKGTITSFVDYDNPSYIQPNGNEPRWIFKHIPEWNAITLSCSTSVECSLLHSPENAKNKWVNLILEGANRAECPMDKKSETYPCGLGVLNCSQQNIILSEYESYPPSPIVLLLSSDGTLSLFNFLTTRPDLPILTSPWSSLPTENERKPLSRPKKVLPPPSQSTNSINTSTISSSVSAFTKPISMTSNLTSGTSVPSQQHQQSRLPLINQGSIQAKPFSAPINNDSYPSEQEKKQLFPTENQPLFPPISRSSSSSDIKPLLTTHQAQVPKDFHSSAAKTSDNSEKRIREKMSHFQKKIQNATLKIGNLNISIGTKEEKESLSNKMDSVENKINDATQNLKALTIDSEKLQKNILNSYNQVNQVETYSRKIKDNHGNSILHQRSLDPITARTYERILEMYYHLNNQQEELHSILDKEWDDYTTKIKNKINLRPENRINSIYKTIEVHRKLLLRIAQRIEEVKSKMPSKKYTVPSKGSESEMNFLKNMMADINLNRSSLTDGFNSLSHEELEAFKNFSCERKISHVKSKSTMDHKAYYIAKRKEQSKKPSSEPSQLTKEVGFKDENRSQKNAAEPPNLMPTNYIPSSNKHPILEVKPVYEPVSPLNSPGLDKTTGFQSITSSVASNAPFRPTNPLSTSNSASAFSFVKKGSTTVPPVHKPEALPAVTSSSGLFFTSLAASNSTVPPNTSVVPSVNKGALQSTSSLIKSIPEKAPPMSIPSFSATSPFQQPSSQHVPTAEPSHLSIKAPFSQKPIQTASSDPTYPAIFNEVKEKVFSAVSEPGGISKIFGFPNSSENKFQSVFSDKSSAATSSSQEVNPKPPASLFTQAKVPETTPAFGATTSSANSPFQSKPFSQTPSIFGQPTTSTSSPSAFNKPAISTSTSIFGKPTASASAPSTCGSASNATPTTTASAFGSKPSTTTSTPTTSIFGKSSAVISTASSPFGNSSATTSTTSSIFGKSTSSGSTSIFGKPTTMSAPTSIFGQSSATSPSSTTSLFGKASTTTTTSIFGKPSTTSPGSSPSLFGKPSPTSPELTSGSEPPPSPESDVKDTFSTPATSDTISTSDKKPILPTYDQSISLSDNLEAINLKEINLPKDKIEKDTEPADSSTTAPVTKPVDSVESNTSTAPPKVEAGISDKTISSFITSAATAYANFQQLASTEAISSAQQIPSSSSSLYGQALAPTTGAFGQSASIFAQPITKTSSVFGQSTFGQGAAPIAPVFGQSTTSNLTAFGQAPATSLSSFGQLATGTNSVFGASTQANSSFNQASNTSVFGQASSFSQPFGSTPANKPAGGSIFSPSGASSAFSQPAFGQAASSSFSSFGSSQDQSSTFGQSQNQSVFGQSNKAFSPTSSSFPQSSGLFDSTGGLFKPSSFGGLGGSPINPTNKSVFGQAPSTFGQTDSSSSGSGIFGASIAQSYAANKFGSSFSGGSFTSGSGSVAQTGFGSPTQQNQTKPGGFGSSPTFGNQSAFGSPSSFGAKPGFGAAPAFGSSGFGSMGGDTNSSFGTYAASNSGASFDALAAQSGGGTFGQAQTSFGSPGFGAPQAQPPPSGFATNAGLDLSKESFSQWR